MFGSLSRVPATHPIKFGVGISAIKTSAADFVAQRVVEGRDTLDRRRTAIFFVWGAGYLGLVQYFIYVPTFTWLFPSAARFVALPWREKLACRAGQLDVLKQVGLDQFIHHPFMLFPCFYLVKETIEKPDAGAAAIWSEGRRKQLQNMREDCIVCWTTWIPAFLVNFSVMPMWGRVPFVAAVSFGFTTYFSFLRGGPSDDAG